MILFLVVFLFTVNEPALIEKMRKEESELGISEENEQKSECSFV